MMMFKYTKKIAMALVSVLFVALSPLSQAGAINNAGLFTTPLPANDDGSTGLVNIGFNLNFYGASYSQLYVNNNGNVTFTQPLSAYTPSGITGTSLPMLAPFFADVDTRGAGSDIVTYGASVINGHNVFGVDWINVGYFASQSNPLNSFQLIITDMGLGNFSFQYNYDKILWETGSASGGGPGGLGGTSAAAGWTNGIGNFYQLAGSLVNGGLLDPNQATGLINNDLNSSTLGQYIFNVSNGAVVDNVPEPESIVLLMLGLMGFGALRRKENKV